MNIHDFEIKLNKFLNSHCVADDVSSFESLMRDSYALNGDEGKYWQNKVVEIYRQWVCLKIADESSALMLSAVKVDSGKDKYDAKVLNSSVEQKNGMPPYGGAKEILNYVNNFGIAVVNGQLKRLFNKAQVREGDLFYSILDMIKYKDVECLFHVDIELRKFGDGKGKENRKKFLAALNSTWINIFADMFKTTKDVDKGIYLFYEQNDIDIPFNKMYNKRTLANYCEDSEDLIDVVFPDIVFYFGWNKTLFPSHLLPYIERRLDLFKQFTPDWWSDFEYVDRKYLQYIRANSAITNSRRFDLSGKLIFTPMGGQNKR